MLESGAKVIIKMQFATTRIKNRHQKVGGIQIFTIFAVMKRWLIILLLTVAAAVAHASSGESFDSTSASRPEMPSTVILSAGSDHAEQLGTPLAAAVASPGTSRLTGEESTPNKAKIRHGGGIPIPIAAHVASNFQIQGCKHTVRHYVAVAFTRSADYYIYALRRIII